jgi:D-sedoheptulose 7-phosphate isomerase
MSVERIQQHFRDHAALALETLDALSLPIAAAVDTLFMALANGNTIFACGAGHASSSAARLAAALLGGFERERPELPGFALSPGQTQGEAVYAQQVRALGHAGDVLLAIDVSGEAEAVLAAVREAHAREMVVVALSGGDAAQLGRALGDADIAICVPSKRAARIDEIHLLIVHCLCDGIDAMLLGED